MYQSSPTLLKKYWNWAIVTGASSGIGKQIAIQLTQQWFNIIAVARDSVKLQELQQELQSEYHTICIPISADLSTHQWISTVIQESDKYDIGVAVMNAWFGTSGLFTNSSLETEINMLELNCTSTLILTHHYVQKFISQQKWAIILLSSILAFQWTAYSANYAATKAYIQTLWEWLAEELQGTWVDILTVAPWPVDTWFSHRAQMNLSNAANAATIAKEIISSLGATTFIYPWLQSKLLWYSISLLPRRAKSKVMKFIMKTIVK